MNNVSANTADLGGVQSLVKTSLNWLTSKRLISTQEAVHELDEKCLPLVICSEYMTKVSLRSCLYKLKKKDDPDPKDFVYQYASRKLEHIHLSLSQYFYKVWRKKDFYEDEDTRRKLKRILLPQGLNCKPCHPINFDYARGMLIMHKPWSFDKPLNFRNKQQTVDEFRIMLENRDVPTSVWTEYMRAVHYSQVRRIEIISRPGTLEADVNLDELNQHDADQHLSFLHSSDMTDSRINPMLSKDQVVDIGLNHDWSIPTFKGKRDITCPGEEYCNRLREQRANSERALERTLEIPVRSNGDEYNIDMLSDEQRVIVLAMIDTIVKFLTNDESYEPLRATIVGMGGCGKSLIINTVISIVRKLTKTNDTVKVAAPSGNAAWNVQGCTLHSLLNINVRTPWASMGEESEDSLKLQLLNLLVLMVDERSMLNSHVTFGAEEHVRDCAYGGHNWKERWGGIPVVLLFGDDYQLPPVDKMGGVIQGFSKYKNKNKPKNISRKRKNDQICDYVGFELLYENMTTYVFELTKNFRTADEEDNALMKRLRTGDQTDEDAQRLANLHLDNFSPDFRKKLESDPKTLHAFAKQEDRKKMNLDLLIKTHRRTKAPVARLKCYLSSNIVGNNTVYPSHFRRQRMIFSFDVCVGAQVCLEITNIDPIVGLYVGAIGTVVEIIYDKSNGPNGDAKEHLPKYIVVDFPSFKPRPGQQVWDKNNPTVRTKSPISILLSFTIQYLIMSTNTQLIYIPLLSTSQLYHL